MNWFVLYYDGNEHKAVHVDDANGLLPYGADSIAGPELAEKLGHDVDILFIVEAEDVHPDAMIVIDDRLADVPTVQL